MKRKDFPTHHAGSSKMSKQGSLGDNTQFALLPIHILSCTLHNLMHGVAYNASNHNATIIAL